MAKVQNFILLSAAGVSKLLPPISQLRKVMRSTMMEYSARKTIVQPVRTQINIPGTTGRLITMPACLGEIMGLKVVCAIPQNVSLGLPTHLGTIQLYTLNGELVAQMDAEEITAKRTAAVSAVATQVLASKESEILSVLGTGVQAESHIRALRELYDFKEVRIWGRTQKKAQVLAEKLGSCVVSDSVAEACHGADIICTVTGAAEPILQADHVTPGAHINVVGASQPTSREIATDLMLRATVVCDCYDAVKIESGDVVQTKAPVNYEIGELVKEGYERRDGEITLFKNLGLACQDIACADLVYKNYIADKNVTETTP